MNINRKRSPRNYWPIGLVIATILILGWYFLYRSSPAPTIKVKGTKSTPTAPQLPTNTTGNNTGGITNQKVNTPTLPPSSDWVSSSNGDITLQEPSSGTLFKSGDPIVGLARVNSVQFILTDNTVGLIAQGNLSVDNGKFSGTVQFTPHANSGKLEVYYPNPSNGAEDDIVDVDVNFSN
ncbi:MAG TPA: hypothetical protein VGS08_02030 [Candidatus Saccharimonadales bacterium]|nr:hypothetical protein [Candidatus Saccharimonadales bacterium]